MDESLPFKINIESEAGKLTSYASGGFATTEEAGISGSTILSRINSMPSISYSENDTIGSAHAGGNTFSHANNLWISASYFVHSGPADTGSITFQHTDTLDTADRLKRYRAGEEIGPNSALMIMMAKPLSDKDIDNLAAYLKDAK